VGVGVGGYAGGAVGTTTGMPGDAATRDVAIGVALGTNAAVADDAVTPGVGVGMMVCAQAATISPTQAKVRRTVSCYRSTGSRI
jgi:hypothetical protein